MNTELSKAIELIKDFCENEYDQEIADDDTMFSDLSEIPIMYTTTADENEYDIQVYADLVNMRITTEIAGIKDYEVVQFESMEEMNNALYYLDFGEYTSYEFEKGEFDYRFNS